MSQVVSDINEEAAIEQALRPYIDGARSGRSDDMGLAFHEDATVYGYLGSDLVAGPIARLFEWHDENGPARGLVAQIACIDIAGTVATVRLELDDWTGHRFTDLFTLLKVGGKWKIMNKVFHLHP